jgi:pyrimidine deaminase RibD-like protein
MIDPHPRGRGRGIEMLREAGVRVVSDFLHEEASAHLSPYLFQSASPKPPVGW